MNKQTPQANRLSRPIVSTIRVSTPEQKPRPTQAKRFVEARSSTVQYLIDVAALAFILAAVLTLIERVTR